VLKQHCHETDGTYGLITDVVIM